MVAKSSIEGQMLTSIYRQNFDEFKKGISRENLLRIGYQLNKEKLICPLIQDDAGEVFSTGLYPKGINLVQDWEEK